MKKEEKPTRCIDPVMKYCQDCLYGWVEYPDWVETYEDLQGCTFECGCMFGFDQGRPEDEPTEEELKAFEEWHRKFYENNVEIKFPSEIPLLEQERIKKNFVDTIDSYLDITGIKKEGE